MGLRQGGWGEDVTKRALSSVSLWRSREQESVYCLTAPYRRLKNKTSSRSACGEQEGGWDFLGSAVSLNRRPEPACFWSHLERESLLPFRPLQSKGSHTWNLSITAWVTDVLFSHSLDNLCSAFSYIIIWYTFFSHLVFNGMNYIISSLKLTHSWIPGFILLIIVFFFLLFEWLI